MSRRFIQLTSVGIGMDDPVLSFFLADRIDAVYASGQYNDPRAKAVVCLRDVRHPAEVVESPAEVVALIEGAQ